MDEMTSNTHNPQRNRTEDRDEWYATIAPMEICIAQFGGNA